MRLPSTPTPRPARLALVTALSLLLLGMAAPARAAGILPTGAPLPAQGALVTARHGVFLLAGRPLYLHGINYEGPSDRPWRMWQDGEFNPTLIARDFDAIAAAGYSPVRIFVQDPLPGEVLDGDFSRLDTVVRLAAVRGLRLLITFNDNADADLQHVARVDALIARHLAGNPAVFGYDLRNEPNLSAIAASLYPPGAPLPLLSPALLKAYHERVSMAASRKAQRGGAYSGGGFAHFSTRTLYYYLNAQHLLNSFLSDNPGYPAVAATPYWTRFLDLANRTLASYLYVQLRAVRTADPTHLVTVGYNSRFWSALPINSVLDFRSIHIYPPAGFDGFHAALRSFEALNALGPSPLVLEEYGISNDVNGPQSSAVREMAMALYLRTLGGGGDLKWMFNDDAVGYSAYENNLGAVDVLGTPKPTYLASAAADSYWAHTPYAGGLVVQPDPVTHAGFVYVARDGMAIGGSQPYSDTRVAYTPTTPGVVWLDWSVPGMLHIMPTNEGRITLTLRRLTGASALAPIATPMAPTAMPTGTPTTGVTPTTTLVPTATIMPTATPTATVMLAPTATLTPSTAVVTNTIATVIAALTGTPGSGEPRGDAFGHACDCGRMAHHRPTAVGLSARPWLYTYATVTATVPLTVTPTMTATAVPTPSPTPLPEVLTNGLTVTLALHAGVPWLLRYSVTGPPPRVPIDLPAPDLQTGWYIISRGHNVAPPFLAPWLNLGGESGLGAPMTEVFRYLGLPTQYFDDVALRIGPHGLTTAPLGLVALGGAPLKRAKELPRKRKHYYDHVTGHNIHGAFLDFWRATGGIKFWGEPLSEEMKEDGLLVQYFTGAEFVLNPGPHGGVGLLPLGQRMWPNVRRVYRL